MAKFIMHIEKSKSWWNGTSTTLCGITFKVEKSSWFGSVTCNACKAIKKAQGGK